MIFRTVQPVTTLMLILLTGVLAPSLCAQQIMEDLTTEQAIVITERFQTDRNLDDNVDSPAIWHGPTGEHWLLATAKETDALIIFDATDGSFLHRIGSEGASMGQLDRPNGIAIIDDLAIIVERDNARLQVFALPSLQSVGFFTHEDLRLPYGLTVDHTGDGWYDLFVTDNYNPAMEGWPAEEELDERVHHFRFSIHAGENSMMDSAGSMSDEESDLLITDNENDNLVLQVEHVNLFGDIWGEGILQKVETIFMDREYNRLLIADEAFSERTVKVYDLDGNFTGEIIPNTYFTSEPEGIALYTCENGSGYWIMTDQHQSTDNKFQVFDRETLNYIGGFKGAVTRNTDGVWLTQTAYGSFDSGAFFPVHNDGSVTAVDWEDIAGGLGLVLRCTR